MAILKHFLTNLRQISFNVKLVSNALVTLDFFAQCVTNEFERKNVTNNFEDSKNKEKSVSENVFFQ